MLVQPHKSSTIPFSDNVTESKGTPKLLVVDDSALVADLVRFALRQCPLSVFSATRSDAALSLLRQEQFALIVTDIKMPGMDGIDFVSTLRALPNYAHTPVLVMSGYEEQHYVEAAFGAGATAFIDKPFTSEELMNFVLTELHIERKLQ